MLPNFKKLVEKIYTNYHLTPNDLEQKAMRRSEWELVLGLLEKKDRLGEDNLRRGIVEQLTKLPTNMLTVHMALIELSRINPAHNNDGVRMVTTNFDNRFVEAGLDICWVDAAPKLPIPKPKIWKSLVHLHGRIAGKNDSGVNLVLTAADFGQAYLTDCWASRFITELFREFTVVFVGYSLGDTVVRYMVDALATEREKGAKYNKAYAFAPTNNISNGNSTLVSFWHARGVNVIPYYNKFKRHQLLEKTLVEWARIRRDPFQARSNIVVNGIKRMPYDEQDPLVERVIWALEDATAAEALAISDPIFDKRDYKKLERWLDHIAKSELMFIPTTGGSKAKLVGNYINLTYTNNLDAKRHHIACWMARHIHVPQLFLWVLQNGGQLHPDFRNLIEERLGKKNSTCDPNIPNKLRLFWSILLNSRQYDHRRWLRILDRHAAATTDQERKVIEDEVILGIAPRLIIKPGKSPGRILWQETIVQQNNTYPIDDYAHLELLAIDDNKWHILSSILTNSNMLTRHAKTLTSHLEVMHELGKIADINVSHSWLFRPSIAEHEQNSDSTKWAHIIDLVRDSYEEVAKKNRRRAENLLQRWVYSQWPLFRRIALHIITEDPKSNIEFTQELMIAGEKPGLWDTDMRREILRFLRCAGNRLPCELSNKIINAIHKGPDWNIADALEGKHNRELAMNREKAIRLHKLAVSGIQLDRKSRKLVNEMELDDADESDNRDEFSTWFSGESSICETEFVPPRLPKGSVDDLVMAMSDKNINQHELRELVVQKCIKVVSALRKLAERDKWPTTYWQGFLWHLDTSIGASSQSLRLPFHVAMILSNAPPELIIKIGSELGDLVKKLANECPVNRESDFKTFWELVWTNRGSGIFSKQDFNDPLTIALNHTVGKMAEAALTRLVMRKPEAGEGLPEDVRLYFDRIAEIQNCHLGRVILVTRLYYLFTVDPAWTRKNMIDQMKLDHGAKATDLWSTFAWSPRFGPNLLREVKTSYLDVLKYRLQEIRNPRKLVAMFLTVCLEHPGNLTDNDILCVVNEFSEKELIIILDCLKRRITGDKIQRDAVWSNGVQPWLDSYWPTVKNRNTTRTSGVFIELLVECRETFPNATCWAKQYLRSIEDNSGGLYSLSKSDHMKRFPNEVLDLIYCVVNDILPNIHKPVVNEILDKINASSINIVADRKFQRLQRIASS